MSTLAPFLRPEGYASPPLRAVLRESSVVGETGRYVLRAWGSRGVRTGPAARTEQPVVLVPGFMAGDGSLALLSRSLRREGFRTYRSHITANVGCTVGASALLEERVESVAERRGSRVLLVGHSLGGMLARGLAVRRPDLVAGIVTLGSPMMAPAAHHASLTRSVEMLIRLGRAGVPGLMSEDCVAGDCARASFAEARAPMPVDVAFTAVYSRRDGIVDWRACIDPLAQAVEVTASHTGMAFDPRVADRVLEALRAAVVLDRR
jgi:triacylglycerol lipase